MELFAHLQIAQAYEESGTDDWINLADRFDHASITPEGEMLPIVNGNPATLRILLAITAAWSTLLSGTALAVEEYNPGFRAGVTDSTYLPIAPATETNRTVPANCATALCSAACGNRNSAGVVPINNSTIERPVAGASSNNTFIAVRPGSSTGVFLRRGDSGSEVTRIQNLLRSAGYFDAASTGFYATLTEAGVKAFQRERGLPVDGIVGEETLTALQGYRPVSPTPSPAPVPQPGVNRLQIGDRGEDVVRLQLALQNTGFYRGAIDGVYAAQTEQAVIAFQQANRLAISGIADSATLARLGVAIDRVALRSGA
jgi:peptidoglycan hydrolase-like protein with peptidoglycan-binding domain